MGLLTWLFGMSKRTAAAQARIESELHGIADDLQAARARMREQLGLTAPAPLANAAGDAVVGATVVTTGQTVAVRSAIEANGSGGHADDDHAADDHAGDDHAGTNGNGDNGSNRANSRSTKRKAGRS